MDFNVKRAQKGFTAYYLLNYTKAQQGKPGPFGRITQSWNSTHGLPHQSTKSSKSFRQTQAKSSKALMAQLG